MIATGTAIALAAAASAGTAAYQTHSANSTNKRSQDYQHDAEVRAQATEDKRLAEESAAEAKRQKEETDSRLSRESRDTQRWNDYLRVNEPMWNAGAGVLNNLYSMAGIRNGQTAMPQLPSGPPPSGMGAPPTSSAAALPPAESFSATNTRARTPYPAPTVQPPQGMSLSQLMAMAAPNASSFNSPRLPAGT